jgi:protein-S-isoprenylcysteine O-methyltransferase Ste14
VDLIKFTKKMPIHSYLVILAFIIIGLILTIQMFAMQQHGSEKLGKPSIAKFYFYSGKITLFTTWAFFITKAIFPEIGYIRVPPSLSWIAVGLLWLGAVIVSLAFRDLGPSLKVGLPKQETQLKTNGIYRFSRNPIYVGVILIAIASCLYFPDLINISFTIYGILIHHKIIRGEERFLSRRFGDEWSAYCAHVRRYL